MKINWIIALLALAYSWTETAHFGYNVLPSSDAEVLADGIALILAALAVRG